MGHRVNLFDVLFGKQPDPGPSLAERELAISSCPCEFAGKVGYCPKERLDGRGDVPCKYALADETVLNRWATTIEMILGSRGSRVQITGGTVGQEVVSMAMCGGSVKDIAVCSSEIIASLRVSSCRARLEPGGQIVIEVPRLYERRD